MITLRSIVAVVAALVAVAARSANAAPTRVVVFLWDGTQRAHMLQMYDAGQLPRLRSMVLAGGSLRTDLVIDTTTCLPGSGDGYDTETGPANSAIVTGYGYPDQANQDNSAPNPIPATRTFFERVKVAYPTVVTGLITSKHYEFWPHVPLSTARAGGGCDPPIDVWYANDVSNATLADQAIAFLQGHATSPFFVYVHFEQPDETGHAAGENSPAYSAALASDDAETGRVLDTLTTLGLTDTTVFVTTDHGFNEGATGHEICNDDDKNVWIATNRCHVVAATVPGHQTGIAPTLFDVYGMPKTVTPPFPSPSLWAAPTVACP